MSAASILRCCPTSTTDLGEPFFTLKRFLAYTYSQHLGQPALIKAFLGASSSAMKVARSRT